MGIIDEQREIAQGFEKLCGRPVEHLEAFGFDHSATRGECMAGMLLMLSLDPDRFEATMELGLICVGVEIGQEARTALVVSLFSELATVATGELEAMAVDAKASIPQRWCAWLLVEVRQARHLTPLGVEKWHRWIAARCK